MNSTQEHLPGNPEGIPTRIDLIGRCFRKFFKGWGRASRREYWSFVLLVIIYIGLVIAAELMIVNPGGEDPSGFFLAAIIAALYGFGLPLFFAGMRRYHDLGHSGWLYALHMFSGFGTLFAFFAMIAPSQPYDNKHGTVPPEAKL